MAKSFFHKSSLLRLKNKLLSAGINWFFLFELKCLDINFLIALANSDFVITLLLILIDLFDIELLIVLLSIKLESFSFLKYSSIDLIVSSSKFFLYLLSTFFTISL